MSNHELHTIPVDFGNCDADGAVRLVTRGTIEAIERAKIHLREGLKVVLTDGELTAMGEVSMRDEMWVAIISKWLD